MTPVKEWAYGLQVSPDGRLSAYTPRWVDWPIRYADGRLGYDAPERLPAGLRRAVVREMDAAVAAGRPYANDYYRPRKGVRSRS